MASSRFVHPYYLCNALLLVAYIALRVQRLHPGQLAREDMFGITREQQIYFCLALLLATRALSAPTLDAYLSSAFMFARASVMVCLFYMAPRTAAVFAALWTLLYAVCPQPRFRLPDSIAALTPPSFRDRVSNNPHPAIYVVWCHATWSPRCSQLAPVLATLAKRYHHPRITFARVDVSKFPQLADTLGISVSPASNELPTVVCFKQSKEVARIPVLDNGGKLPAKWTRGFTAAHVAEQLDLVTHLTTARGWEADAQRKYNEKKSR